MAFTIQHASPVAIRDRDACKQRRRRSAPRLGAARVRCCAAGTSSSPSPSASHQAQSAGVGIQGRRAAASSVIAAFVAGAGGAAFAKGPKTDVPVSGKAALGQIGEYDKLTKLAPGQPKVAVKEENRKFKPSSASKEAKGPVKESERMKAFAESKKVAAKPASDSKAAPAKKSKEPKKAAPAAKKKAAPAAKKKSKPRGNDSPGSPVPGVLLVTAIGAGAYYTSNTGGAPSGRFAGDSAPAVKAAPAAAPAAAEAPAAPPASDKLPNAVEAAEWIDRWRAKQA